ncbi:MAG: hypothetical protein KF893_09295 [Caldilineaceae bacterium]|nr:hypothetical protein [Caldilineaceae bacterium]
MNQHPNPDALSAHWQRVAEIGAEEGRLPVIGVGVGSFHAEGLLFLLAWRRLARRSTGMLDPRLVVGGEGELWLMASQIWQSRQDPLAVAGTHHIFYAGSDVATRAAALTVNTRPNAEFGQPFLPTGMAWMLTPTALAGSGRADLEHLPFFLNEPLFMAVAAPPAPSSWIDGFEALAVVALAVALVLAALLF